MAGAPPEPVPEPRRRWWGLVAAATGVVAVLAALGPGSGPSSPIEPAPEMPLPPPPGAAATARSTPSSEADVSSPVAAPAGPAVGVFRAFVSGVGRGDTDAVIELLAEQLPAIEGVGTAQWPMLPTDAGLWTDGTLGHDEVAGFVGYLSASRSTTSLRGCESWADGPHAVIATCGYESTGGALTSLGGATESGHFHGVVVAGRVVGLIRHTDIGGEAWPRLAEWLGGDGEPLPASLGGPARGDELDPVYTAASAVEHRALADEMAAATLRTAPGYAVSRLH